VAVDARWRYESGQAVEQLQWGEDQRAVPVRTGLAALVEKLSAIELL
jgi:hypothetical protein